MPWGRPTISDHFSPFSPFFAGRENGTRGDMFTPAHENREQDTSIAAPDLFWAMAANFRVENQEASAGPLPIMRRRKRGIPVPPGLTTRIC
jgi:hypothetical protein